jgi:hypothetical protein
MKYPDDLLNHEDGIGAFFNPAEGEEFMLRFHHLLAAFRKQGEDLTDDEGETVRGFVESSNISPAFVRRVVRDHGSAAIGRAYLIKDFQETPDMEYLLRRAKGPFYRNRYPTISFVGGEESAPATG